MFYVFLTTGYSCYNNGQLINVFSSILQSIFWHASARFADWVWTSVLNPDTPRCVRWDTSELSVTCSLPVVQPLFRFL